ncbi:MAG: CotH kinase family protein [Flavobacteriales bacterium]|nr:CotH kinase family protein [Flavobacteriales bacterium]
MLLHRYIPLLLPAACPLLLAAQTFTGNGANIPDDGTALEIPLAVTGLSDLDTVGFGLEQVCITIDHSWVSDLEVKLVAPDGTAVLLVSGQGGDSDHFTGTCFRGDAGTPITQGTPPYSGTFRALGDLGTINNGQSGNGTWTLYVMDNYPFADAGAVASWSITFGSDPATPFTLGSSALPIVVINTNGQPIPDEVKITAHMGVVDNGPGNLNHPQDPFNGYNGDIGIEMRGNSSLWMSPKKSYTVELRTGSGLDLEVPLLGMPAESDWVLQANYFDKSLMNNTLTHHLFRAMGHYAPRQRYVEVVLNGTYVGIYVLTEKIKRGADRVNIAKLQPDETFGDDLTGGYILSVERDEGNGFISEHPPMASPYGQYVFLEYRYPKPDNIVPDQEAYIQGFIGAFEDALAGPAFQDSTTGYRAYIDVPSFIDLFLINELSRNVDGYRLSTFLYKDKDSNGGSLHAGPVWDYDIAWGNADYCQGSDIAGWAYMFSDICPDHSNQMPFWWHRLLEDSAFVDAVRCRWDELRDGILSPAHVATFADSVATLLQGAQERNFTVWPILGQYVWPNPSPIPATYAGEVQELNDFMEDRWAWLDANLPGDPSCATSTGLHTISTVVEAPFPNPFGTIAYFRTVSGSPVMVRLLDPLGRVVASAGPFMGKGAMHHLAVPQELAPGTYLLEATDRDGNRSSFRLQH